MEVLSTIDQVRARTARARAAGGRVGLVPTMGALHAGHVSLIGAAVADGCDALVTVFVNPLQFAAGEDLDAYRRSCNCSSSRFRCRSGWGWTRWR